MLRSLSALLYPLRPEARQRWRVGLALGFHKVEVYKEAREFTDFLQKMYDNTPQGGQP